MKKFTKHSKDTTSIKFIPSNNRLVSWSWDSTIMVHDDN